MGFLGSVAGPKRVEVWRQLSAEIGAEFIAGSPWRVTKVQARVRDWTITLDTFYMHRACWTRLRAPFVSRDGFHFRIFRTNPIFEFRKLLGFQDIEVGHSDFDDRFIIHGNDESKVRTLFANARIRQRIQAQPNPLLRIRDNDGLFRRLPREVDELYFATAGAVGNIDRLKGMFDLFAEVLDQLCQIGSAKPEDPGVAL